MKRLNVDQGASEEHSRVRGIEYVVLKIEDQKIFQDDQISELGDELWSYIDGNPSANLCVDFGNVDFCSAVFFGKLITAQKKLEYTHRNSLGLKNLQPGIYEIFSITKLDKLFDIDEASKNAYQQSRA